MSFRKLLRVVLAIRMFETLTALRAFSLTTSRFAGILARGH